ncbi:hypothetical protein [Candidatus Uabimicrobium amorphum]|uniref:Uncharacterized protein n=1 Tax=Uabimicrobium amorphum TaxID=2596890 RepID=A0A5S9F465_UABAM|nr:hypothetical protein [Candidatus Uabimicrobium amorphum]BBM83892.1 hypothetical protein UABAM_02247 [Candidatus Uabimicrobium amorphum]
MEVKQGYSVAKDDTEFSNSLDKIVDYRGDSTVFMQDGSTVEGYIFDVVAETLHIYPIEGDKKEIPLTEVSKIEVTGKDTAEGKSWEAWVAKKKKEKEQQQNEE